MAGKGKKKKNGNKDNGSSNGDKGKKGGKGSGGKARKSAGKGRSSKFQGDIFSEAAMDNAYLCCHNIQDVLKARGFPWPEAQKKKKKGKK